MYLTRASPTPLRLAEAILAEAPAHARALKLQQESKRRVGSYKLDQALIDQSIEEVEHCGQRQPTHRCRRLKRPPS